MPGLFALLEIPLSGMASLTCGNLSFIFHLVQAYQGQKFKLPVIGDLAQEWAKKIDI